jgi:hypothetical protein
LISNDHLSASAFHSVAYIFDKLLLHIEPFLRPTPFPLEI